VNGQKIWTSYGDKADWMFLLVRTDSSARKQDGITFVLLDMATPGVSVRPIRLISGASPFCETFFTDVRIPERNVVGERNRGWAIARALLGHERSMIADVYKERDDAPRLLRAARQELGEIDGRLADPLVRDRITQLEIDQACFDGTIARGKAAAKAGDKPGHETSILKYYGTELNQRRRELHVAIAGPRALGWEGPGFAEDDLKLTRDWLRSRGNTIEGGTSEIQLNIIAKRVLGLPGL
jgi:alkylation response protein AidB-like acyl-CoA dehydrogenase